MEFRTGFSSIYIRICHICIIFIQSCNSCINYSP
ncbi:hypothetical protein MTR67_040218 [Solanum verrucosum]|uniref:Uncharacterized protein n=1 Tax=Solanum verrucosum TaxID=315347 RepID=A0AAF0ZR72_SOLVR|nr:hypothetical protein MTR67_040218 [Solanum verrucosum]